MQRRFWLTLFLLIGILSASVQPAIARIFFDNSEIKFQTAIMREGDVLYVPLRELAKGMGLEITYSSSQDFYTINRTADSRAVIFRLNSRKVKVNGRDDELNDPILLIKNSFYVPLNDFLWLFGYFVERDNKAGYYIVSRLNTVSWDKQTLTLKGEAPLTVELSTVPEGYLLLLRNCILGLDPQEIKLVDGVITGIEYKQRALNPGLVQVLIRTADSPQYTVVKEDKSNNYTMRFTYQPRSPEIKIISPPVDSQASGPAGSARIYAFTSEGTDKGRQVILYANERLRPSDLKYLTDPPRAFVDIPNSFYTATLNILRFNDQNVKTVRAAQFDKGIVRVVADLTDPKNKPVLSLTEDGRALILSFGTITTAAIIAKPPLEPVRTLPAANSQSLKGLRVAVIVGHGGNDPGAISRQGLMEKNLTLEMAKKLQTLLKEKGAAALLSREDDRNISLDDQAKFAQNAKADILVSLHLNNFTNDSINGAESFYYKPLDYDLAKCVHDELVKQTQLANRGLRKAMMHNLNHTAMPGVLLEPLFLSNRKEENLIKSADFQWKMMRAVVSGIENYQQQKK